MGDADAPTNYTNRENYSSWQWSMALMPPLLLPKLAESLFQVLTTLTTRERPSLTTMAPGMLLLPMVAPLTTWLPPQTAFYTVSLTVLRSSWTVVQPFNRASGLHRWQG